MAIRNNSNSICAIQGALLVIVLGAIGCSRRAQISGRVTLDEQPVAGAQVVFVAEDNSKEAPLVAQSDDRGEYGMVANTAAGIPPGKYKVTRNSATNQRRDLPKIALSVEIRLTTYLVEEV